MKEGDDYMLVDGKVHNFWRDKYECENTIIRYGIKNDDGLSSVEVYLKQINIIPIPNKTKFKFKDSTGKGKEMQP